MGHGQGEHTAWGCVWGRAADAVPKLDKGTRSGFALWGPAGPCPACFKAELPL